MVEEVAEMPCILGSQSYLSLIKAKYDFLIRAYSELIAHIIFLGGGSSGGTPQKNM